LAPLPGEFSEGDIFGGRLSRRSGPGWFAARLGLVFGLFCGATMGEAAWRAAEAAFRSLPPPGWRSHPPALPPETSVDLGSIGALAGEQTPRSGAWWRPRAAIQPELRPLSMELRLPEGGLLEAWLAASPEGGGEIADFGVRLEHVERQARVTPLHRSAQGERRVACSAPFPDLPDQDFPLVLEPKPGGVQVTVDATTVFCPVTIKENPPLVRTGARRVGLSKLAWGEISQGESASHLPRGLYWLAGAALGLLFILAQLSVGTPPTWVLFSSAPLLLSPLLLPWEADWLADVLQADGIAGSRLIVGLPAVLCFLWTLLMHAGRAARDPRPAREWSWAAPFAGSLPLAMEIAAAPGNTPFSLAFMVALVGALGAVALAIAALALLGHARPRRVVSLALFPALACGLLAFWAGPLDRGSVLLAALAGFAGALGGAELSRGLRSGRVAAGLLLSIALIAADFALLGLGPIGRSRFVQPLAPNHEPTISKPCINLFGLSHPRGHDGEPGGLVFTLERDWRVVRVPSPHQPPPESTRCLAHVILVGPGLGSLPAPGFASGWNEALHLARLSYSLAEERLVAARTLGLLGRLEAHLEGDPRPRIFVLDPSVSDPGALASVRRQLPVGRPAGAVVDPLDITWRSAQGLRPSPEQIADVLQSELARAFIDFGLVRPKMRPSPTEPTHVEDL
jgi:hypothetical protein